MCPTVSSPASGCRPAVAASDDVVSGLRVDGGVKQWPAIALQIYMHHEVPARRGQGESIRPRDGVEW